MANPVNKEVIDKAIKYINASIDLYNIKNPDDPLTFDEVLRYLTYQCKCKELSK